MVDRSEMVGAQRREVECQSGWNMTILAIEEECWTIGLSPRKLLCIDYVGRMRGLGVVGVVRGIREISIGGFWVC